MSVTALFDIARSAIMASRTALEVTSNNIANVNTPDYSRQDAILEISSPQMTGVGEIGRGVDVTDIKRQYDQFLETQLSNENSNMGKTSVLSDIYSKLEDSFNEQTGNGLSSSINGLFNAWQGLSTNPGDSAQRNLVLTNSQEFIDKSKEIEKSLTDLNASVDKEVPSVVDNINKLADTIAQLNDQISTTESGSTHQANALRDQRTGALKSLATLVQFNSYEDESGRVNVIVGQRNLVSGKIVHPMQMSKTSDNKDIIMVDSVDITSNINGGQLGGLLTLKNSDQSGIPYALSNLRRTVGSITNEINIIQSSGYGLNQSTTGQDLFNSYPPTVTNVNSTTVTDVSATIIDRTALTYKDYEIRFTDSSTYTIYDVNTQTSASATLSGNVLNVDGINVTFSGAPQAGDVFKLSPTALAITDSGVAITDIEQLAAASAPPGLPGDNKNALKVVELAQLQHPANSAMKDSTFSNFYASFVDAIGGLSKDATDSNTYETNMYNQLSQQRDSVSAVSLDEESMNLIRYQKGYEAAAKLVTTTNDMLDTLLALVRS
ncbi:MAG: flagellar hook-associated protein FlgK [Nitrospirae bacterium]|nr:flagellar hook-associated protein FlgK [Nitrospirota bacterium]MBF0591023.1 flagellar hook-associated protein FlgK [Nitrospirota bacterium]